MGMNRKHVVAPEHQKILLKEQSIGVSSMDYKRQASLELEEEFAREILD